jgi:hypothetical protein
MTMRNAKLFPLLIAAVLMAFTGCSYTKEVKSTEARPPVVEKQTIVETPPPSVVIKPAY